MIANTCRSVRDWNFLIESQIARKSIKSDHNSRSRDCLPEKSTFNLIFFLLASFSFIFSGQGRSARYHRRLDYISHRFCFHCHSLINNSLGLLVFPLKFTGRFNAILIVVWSIMSPLLLLCPLLSSIELLLPFCKSISCSDEFSPFVGVSGFADSCGLFLELISQLCCFPGNFICKCKQSGICGWVLGNKENISIIDVTQFIITTKRKKNRRQ